MEFPEGNAQSDDIFGGGFHGEGPLCTLAGRPVQGAEHGAPDSLTGSRCFCVCATCTAAAGRLDDTSR